MVRCSPPSLEDPGEQRERERAGTVAGVGPSVLTADGAPSAIRNSRQNLAYVLRCHEGHGDLPLIGMMLWDDDARFVVTMGRWASASLI